MCAPVHARPLFHSGADIMTHPAAIHRTPGATCARTSGRTCRQAVLLQKQRLKWEYKDPRL